MENKINENSGLNGYDFQDESTTTDFERSELEKDIRQGQSDKSSVTNAEEFIEPDPNHSNDTIQDYSPDSPEFYEDEEDDDFEDVIDLDDDFGEDETDESDDILFNRNSNL